MSGLYFGSEKWIIKCGFAMVSFESGGLSVASQINKISEIASFATYFLSLCPFRSDLKRGCD